MMISDEYGLLFVHIPKTAGTSITGAFKSAGIGTKKHPLCHPDGKHESVAKFVDRHGIEIFRKYLSFCVVRHPLDRLISHYRYKPAQNRKELMEGNLLSLDGYIDAIESGLVGKFERVAPQNYFVTDQSLNVLVDRIIRYEDLQNGFRGICEESGLPNLDLPRLNVSQFQTIAPTPRAKQFVERYYARDYELFGY